MQNKIRQFYYNNQEMAKIIFFALVAFAILALLFAVFLLYGSNTPTPALESYPDETILENKMTVFGMEKLLDYGFDSGIYYDANHQLDIFFYNIMKNEDYPKLDLIEDSIQVNDDNYSFSLLSSDNRQFDVAISGKKTSDYQLTISYLNGIILDYISTPAKVPHKNPETIDTSLFPYSIVREPKPIIITKLDTGTVDYEIIVDSCGNQAIKNQARTTVAGWFSSMEYDPADFNFVIPDYCQNDHADDHGM